MKKIVVMKKIVIIVHDYQEYINFELFCFEFELLKIRLVERWEFKLTNENLFALKEELTTKLAELEFNKTNCTIGIYSPYIFMETITMPKLNLLEETKAISLKLDKLYNNFNDKFYSMKTKFTYNKTTRKHVVLAIEKNRYNSILEKLNELNIDIDKVVFYPMALASSIGKKHIFPAETVGLFINLERTYTSLIVTKGSNLIDYKVLDLGIMTLHDLLKDKNEEEIEHIVEENKGSLNSENLKKVKDYITSIVKAVKTMCYHNDFNITEFCLNSEYGIDKILKTLIEKELKVPLKITSKQIRSSNAGLQAISILKTQTPTFPVKVK